MTPPKKPLPRQARLAMEALAITALGFGFGLLIPTGYRAEGLVGMIFCVAWLAWMMLQEIRHIVGCWHLMARHRRQTRKGGRRYE